MTPLNNVDQFINTYYMNMIKRNTETKIYNLQQNQKKMKSDNPIQSNLNMTDSNKLSNSDPFIIKSSNNLSNSDTLIINSSNKNRSKSNLNPFPDNFNDYQFEMFQRYLENKIKDIKDLNDSIISINNRSITDQKLLIKSPIYDNQKIITNNSELIISNPIIATMTLISKLNTDVNLLNFSKYISLDHDNIISVKFNKDNNLIERSLEKPKKSKKNNKKPKYFYNQCTIKINCMNNKVVNLKLFLNGKIQMTGCKSLENAFIALDKLKVELTKLENLFHNKYIKHDDNTITKIDIISNKKFTIDPPSIQLINSVFDINIHINRNKLHSLLINKYNMHATFQPIIYVGINCKFISKSGNTVSILIFQTGKIILTAAKKSEDITESYNFIKKIIFDNFNEIIQ